MKATQENINSLPFKLGEIFYNTKNHWWMIFKFETTKWNDGTETITLKYKSVPEFTWMPSQYNLKLEKFLEENKETLKTYIFHEHILNPKPINEELLR